MKKSPVVQYLETEAARYKQLAAEKAIQSLHKSADGKSINDLDARMIRDHEIRAESFKTAATIVAGH